MGIINFDATIYSLNNGCLLQRERHSGGYEKGFTEWLWYEDADVVCLQETKTMESQVDVGQLKGGFLSTIIGSVLRKKGYSGVAILCKHKPDNVTIGTGIDYMDFEGRNIRVDLLIFLL